MTKNRPRYAQILLDVPIAPHFDYEIPGDWPRAPLTGQWVVVPWGKTRRIGIVAGVTDATSIDASRIRALSELLEDAPQLPSSWFALGRFAAAYYHRQPGEILMPAVPKLLRVVPRAPSAKTGNKPASAFARAQKKFAALLAAHSPSRGILQPRDLTTDQQLASDSLAAQTGFTVSLLHGITGSGKTEVYMRRLAQLLAAAPDNQVLMLVPEIALTPQLAERVRAALGNSVAVLHSGMAEAERAAHWLAAVQGNVRIVIGTRLSVLVPLPKLAGIVVDEEHDPSFKQQEGAQYSARDLAIVRAREHNVPVILGSATPSLESWHAGRRDRYTLLTMDKRATGAPLPTIQIETLRGVGQGRAANQAGEQAGKLVEGFCDASVVALEQCLHAGDQALVFLNRRGYSPVLSCGHCGWLSECNQCSAYRVLHRLAGERSGQAAYRLICHHCASETSVPRACPACGDVSLQPLGRGTQRVEEILAQRFPQARIGRLDRDVARRRGAADAMLDAIHQGDVDIIVGTQMLAKGHDFRGLNLVIVLDADGALFASDYRAPERLFATLTQVAGRAGRNAPSASPGRVIVQTRFADHPLFASLLAHDYAGFADAQLVERRAAVLPPFSHQALLRLEATQLEHALTFGHDASQVGRTLAASTHIGTTGQAEFAGLTVYDPVPMPLARLAGRARVQLLVESVSRPVLHRFLAQWIAHLQQIKTPVRWQMEIDPAQI